MNVAALFATTKNWGKSKYLSEGEWMFLIASKGISYVDIDTYELKN